MIRPIFNLLPLFIVKWIARRMGEIIYVNGVAYCAATNGVLVRQEGERK